MSDDQEYECKKWWEIRDVRHKGFDVDREWSTYDNLLEPFKREHYDDPGEAARTVYKQLKINTEQAVMDDTFGAGWAIDVQKVEEVRRFDGKYHRYEGVDAEDECYVYYIAQRWNKDYERYDVDFADDDEIDQIFEEEFKAAEQRQKDAVARNEAEVRARREGVEEIEEEEYEEEEP